MAPALLPPRALRSARPGPAASLLQNHLHPCIPLPVSPPARTAPSRPKDPDSANPPKTRHPFAMLARAPTAATGRLQSSSVSRCARPAAGRAALRVRAEAGPGGAPQGGSSGTQSSRASSAAAKPSFSSAVDRMATVSAHKRGGRGSGGAARGRLRGAAAVSGRQKQRRARDRTPLRCTRTGHQLTFPAHTHSAPLPPAALRLAVHRLRRAGGHRLLRHARPGRRDGGDHHRRGHCRRPRRQRAHV